MLSKCFRVSAILDFLPTGNGSQLAGSREVNRNASGTRLDIEENEITKYLVYSDILRHS
jgi:hypothetical protein